MKTVTFLLLACSAFAQIPPPDMAPKLDLSRLTSRIQAVCPVKGVVEAPNLADKSTWRVDLDPAATAEQKSNAASIIATWTPQDWNPTPAERRAIKYAEKVDKWSLSVVRYQARLLDPTLTTQQKNKIQNKLDASILKVQQLSTQIETEDPD